MVSPRKSRRKSGCFSRTTTSTPARASRKPSIIRAGPPPAMQQPVINASWLLIAGIVYGCPLLSKSKRRTNGIFLPNWTWLEMRSRRDRLGHCCQTYPFPTPLLSRHCCFSSILRNATELSLKYDGGAFALTKICHRLGGHRFAAAQKLGVPSSLQMKSLLESAL